MLQTTMQLQTEHPQPPLFAGASETMWPNKSPKFHHIPHRRGIICPVGEKVAASAEESQVGYTHSLIRVDVVT